MKAKQILIALTAALATQLVAATPADSTVEIVHASQVEWTHLNPKRGDLAPKAGTLWGDREGTGPTGFLLKPPQDFESPPHIHNISYRGVVIEGVIHNDDPGAANMWMPAGSFWTQPKGEVHITAAAGSGSLAYIEIEEGPYLVQPEDEAFDSGERPVNMDKDNLVWLTADDMKWIQADGAAIAVLWGKTEAGQLNGSMLRLPAGFNGSILTEAKRFGAVIVQGEPSYTQSSGDTFTLEAGSYVRSVGRSTHKIKAADNEASTLYIRTDGPYRVVADK
ncbi:DUF4437 domain-containing protein [Coraliomargarita algicola]|uniref:DUF4437 domain-containing protein n=1 Tax=Coraliomargarita algicola TaxID=3092156 RepID=A0ABZ0RNQ5_9BACT|nr:DUF4437 domain-containing protein [Coraliomargarita sp. J2-16]WPJ97152.1 DUF4437 domain-containing protein [Coraliomargarita sp. J2-16]